MRNAEGAMARPAAATCSNTPPRRPPDAVFSEVTSPGQAALYRLSGDPNPVGPRSGFGARLQMRWRMHGGMFFPNACKTQGTRQDHLLIEFIC